jgi:hypothetical protein
MLIVVCRRGSCGLINRMLRAEGLHDVQHGHLSLLAGSDIEILKAGQSEVFLIAADHQRAEELLRTLRTCPIRAETGSLFEVYIMA